MKTLTREELINLITSYASNEDLAYFLKKVTDLKASYDWETDVYHITGPTEFYIFD